MATINGDDNDNTLGGGLGDDLIQGFGGDDNLAGGGGDDTLIGGDGDDRLRGGRGDDHFVGNATGRIAGEGDEVTYRNDAGIVHGVTIDLAAGTGTDGWGDNDTFEDIQQVTGSHLADTLLGSDATNVFSGGAGDDLIDGRDGWDFVWYGSATSGVVVDLAAGTATGGQGNDTLVDMEGVGGSNFSDRIFGTDRTNLVEWFSLDQLGNEFTPRNQNGSNDFLDGRGGLDGVEYDQENESVVINLNKDRAQDGSGHVDTLVNVEWASGSQADDRITGARKEDNFLRGNGGDDRINGLSGNDTVQGGRGDDLLRGGAGDDLLQGGGGADVLRGGGGKDLLKGGGGPDEFVFARVKDSRPGEATTDQIFGFHGKDVIVLTAIDAVSDQAGNQHFTFDEGGGFRAGEIRFREVSDGLRIELNVDHDIRAEMSILLNGFTGTLNQGDFEL
ncbi:Hemolysin-type calcium-binding protein region [Rubellimicrobium mesophilum DSM 19309]|uniref:Hemolysin-type calcium-binding protein region n=1 Tax=Rubellimicrobium mesophilum DSM 19309 TaxID=442562 RepID=A0A017HKA9_9RHOB|nr:calcium-binding protein [Rubellimicrobium mesophilum]EYD74932.1 Hemolysin-type calcium-binding protein region [Rubellimicrobium mesophilum DSM 19309]